MDKDIKRLLRLEKIQGFQLLDSEKKKLADWKANQKRVEPPKKIKAPKGSKIMEMGAETGPTILPVSSIGEATVENKLVKNVVKDEDKETGEMEE